MEYMLGFSLAHSLKSSSITSANSLNLKEAPSYRTSRSKLAFYSWECVKSTEHVLFISYKFVKGFFAITLLLLVTFS